MGTTAPLVGIALNSTNVIGTSDGGRYDFRRSDLAAAGGGGTSTSSVNDAGSSATPEETYLELDTGGVREVRLASGGSKRSYNTTGENPIAISSAFSLNGTNFFATLSGTDNAIRLFDMAANAYTAPVATNTLSSPQGFDVYKRLSAPDALTNLQFVVCNNGNIRDFNLRGETNNHVSSNPGQGMKDIVIATDTKQCFTAVRSSSEDGQIKVHGYPVATETNHAPAVAVAFGPVLARVGESFSVAVPAGTFSDYNPDQSLTLALPGLPAGLAWEAASRTLSGTPTTPGVFPLALIATDNGTPARSATNAFDLVVARAPSGPDDPDAPVVTPPAAPAPVLAGGSVTLAVSATGPEPVRYQWLRDGALLVGETNAVLNLVNVQTNQAGNYAALVVAGADGSSVAVVSGVMPLTVVLSPQLVVAAGSNAVVVAGQAPSGAMIQWRHNGTLISGALSAPLVITDAQLTDSGSYDMVVSSAGGSFTTAPPVLVYVATSQTYSKLEELPGWTQRGGGEPVSLVSGRLQDNNNPGSTDWSTFALTNFESGAGLGAAQYRLKMNKVAIQADGIFGQSGNGSAFYWRSRNMGTGSEQGYSLMLESNVRFNSHRDWLTLSARRADGVITNYGEVFFAPRGEIDVVIVDTGARVTVQLNGTTVYDVASWIPQTGTIGFYNGNGPGHYIDEISVVSFAPPVVVLPPQALTVPRGGTEQLTAAVWGDAPLAFQWLKEGAVLPGATNVALVFTNAQWADAGGYQVVMTNWSGAVTSSVAALTVTPTVATASVASTNRLYGQTNPVFSVSASGLLAGDDVAVVASTAAGTNSPVGSYAITLSLTGSGATNYVLQATQGTLAVGQAPLTVTAGSANRIYGAANPVFTGTVGGLVNGDVVTAEYGTSATVASGAGVYAVTVTAWHDPGGRLGNYTVTTNAGALTVMKAGLAVNIQSTSRVYGSTNPVFSGVIAGLQNGESITGDYSTTATTSSPPGAYPITVAALHDPGGKLPNYTVTTNQGTLTVTKAMLLVAADDKTRGYGATNPVLTATFTGFVNGQTLVGSDVVGNPALSTTASPNSPVGVYPISAAPGSLASANYSFSLSNGVLTVSTAALTVNIDNTNRVYGATNPVFTGTVGGLVNGDEVTAEFSTAATTASGAGVYPITVAALNDPGGRLGNYTVVTNAGTLTVRAAIAGAQVAVAEAGREFRMTFGGQAGVAYVVEVSEDLVGWTLLTNIVGTAEGIPVVDAATAGRRFYRVRTVE